MKRIILKLLFLVSALQIFAVELKSSETSMDDSKKYSGDYFFSGKELNFSGEAEDIYFKGDVLNFTGRSTSHLNAGGRIININGIVEDNLTVIAKEVYIKGTVNGTVMIFSKNIVFEEGSVINGTVFMLGKNIILRGAVNGDLKSAGGEIVFDSVINGNVEIGAGKIELKDNAEINGDFKYYAENELKNIDKSRISGVIQFSEFKNSKYKNWGDDDRKFKKAMFGFMNIFRLGMLVSMLIGGLLLLLFPAMKTIEQERSNRNFWISLPWGLIASLIFISINMFLIVIPPLFFILLLASLPLLFVSQIFGITMGGQYLFKIFKWKINSRFVYLAFGFVFYLVLQFIPVLCMLSVIFFSSLGWGFMIQKLFKKEF